MARTFRGQAEQSDEAISIVMIVQVACGEGSQRLAVQAVWRSRAGFDDISFVQFEFYFSGYILLGHIHKGLDCLTQRCEPFSFVYDLCKFVAQIFFYFHGCAVQYQLFQLLMGSHQDSSAGCFIYAAGFHTYHTVFHDINNADSMFAAQSVQLGNDLGNFHFFAV